MTVAMHRLPCRQDPRDDLASRDVRIVDTSGRVIEATRRKEYDPIK
jgi:hypothetical protein